jgi:hypothetical protein
VVQSPGIAHLARQLDAMPWLRGSALDLRVGPAASAASLVVAMRSPAAWVPAAIMIPTIWLSDTPRTLAPMSRMRGTRHYRRTRARCVETSSPTDGRRSDDRHEPVSPTGAADLGRRNP